jgi:hypothetical protein
MFEFQAVRRSFPRNIAENSEAASFLCQTTSFETEVQEFLRMDYLQWKTQMRSEYFSPECFGGKYKPLKKHNSRRIIS